MVKRFGFVVSALLWMVCASAAAQQPPAPVNPQEEADHEALRRLRATYEQAIREGRVDLLQPHLHSDFHGVMVTGRAVNSFAELQQYWRDIKELIGEGGSYATTLNPERSVIVGDIAMARGTTDDVVRTGDGDEFRFSTQWGATLQREGSDWKIRYVQGSMDPIANPFVREFTQRALLRTGGGALLAGIIVGIAFGWIWHKRRVRRTA